MAIGELKTPFITIVGSILQGVFKVFFVVREFKLRVKGFGGTWKHEVPWLMGLKHQGENHIFCKVNDFLVGGWTDPFEKYARQIGSFPQVGVKIKNIWNHHRALIFGSQLGW